MQEKLKRFNEIDLEKFEEKLRLLRDEIPGSKSIKSLHDCVHIANISKTYAPIYRAFIYTNSDDTVDLIILQDDYLTNKVKMKTVENIEILGKELLEYIKK